MIIFLASLQNSRPIECLVLDVLMMNTTKHCINSSKNFAFVLNETFSCSFFSVDLYYVCWLCIYMVRESMFLVDALIEIVKVRLLIQHLVDAFGWSSNELNQLIFSKYIFSCNNAVLIDSLCANSICIPKPIFYLDTLHTPSTLV